MRNSQSEYNAILDNENAQGRQLTQSICMEILTRHGYSSEQAKNGAYVYLHHKPYLISRQRGSETEYTRILDAFGATGKKPKECIVHLEQLGFSYGQSKTAVHCYRKKKGLIR